MTGPCPCHRADVPALLDSAELVLRAKLRLPATGRVRGATCEFAQAANCWIDIPKPCDSCTEDAGVPELGNVVSLKKFREPPEPLVAFFFDRPAAGKRLGSIQVLSPLVLRRAVDQVVPSLAKRWVRLDDGHALFASHLVEAWLGREFGPFDIPGWPAYTPSGGPVCFPFDPPLGECWVEYLDLWGRGVATFLWTAEEAERYPADDFAKVRAFVLYAAELVLRIDPTKKWRGYYAVRDGPNRLRAARR